MYSLIIPVYKNEDSIPELIETVAGLDRKLDGKLEAVFVVDGSPDQSAALLQSLLTEQTFSARLLLLSRNFGAFAAIRTGLQVAQGPYFAVMAADLQEPPDLILDFFASLSKDEADVTVGTRSARNDPWLSRVLSGLFWATYRKFVVPQMPPGGVDVFGCNRAFRDCLLSCEEANSSLVALIFWIGFRRKEVAYVRGVRAQGVSAWTFRKKFNYLMDNVFAFTDLPIKLLLGLGALGVFVSVVLALVELITRLSGYESVPGYVSTILVVLFFGGLNIFGLGVVGSYAWRAYENTKRRPLAIIARTLEFPAHADKRYKSKAIGG